MTVHNQCSRAARALLADPALRPATEGPKGVFTELDVMFLAAREARLQDRSKDEQDAWWREAQHEASQVMGALFRTSKAARFGPVTDFSRLTEPDNVRHVGKIIYANPAGPMTVKTPNGTFGRLMVSDSESPRARPGRRAGADRDDFVTWSAQLVTEAERPRSPDEREILRLRAENSALRAENQEKAQEVGRLRDLLASAVTRDEFDSAIATLKKVA